MTGRKLLRSGVTLLVGLALLAPTVSVTSVYAQTPGGSGDQLDFTDNGIVNAGDADAVIDAWRSGQEQEQCVSAGSADKNLDGTGCVSVADVQVLLEQWGQQADSTQPVPEAGDGFGAAATDEYTVNSSGDGGDADPADGECATSGGSCTLRAAIEQSNRRAGRETIKFAIGSCGSVSTITPSSGLTIDDPTNSGVTIDGYTQCGASPNTKPLMGPNAGGDAKILIELKGNFTENVNGIEIKTDNNVIRGLAIFNWDRQVRLSSGASENRIEGNFLGTNAGNTFKSGGIRTHHAEGIRIEFGPSNNVIGGNTPAARNIISGNGNDGVHLQGDVRNNRIIGNYIGLAQNGRDELRNQADGVDFEIGPQGNWLGGEGPGEGNVIGGNFSDGIEISHSTETKFNRVVANYFGMTATGTGVAANDNNGISFEDAVDFNYAYDNIVGGNGANGIRFYVLATNTQVYNNWVGVRPDGTTPMPNGTNTASDKGYNGLLGMGGSQHNTIRNNIFANNPHNGILLSNTSDSTKNNFGFTDFNTFSQNTIYNNGQKGIELLCKTNPDDGENYCSNQGLAAPQISSATTTRVTGKTCANCKVEVFIADSGDEGRTFVGQGVADAAGNYSVGVINVANGQRVTTTATDAKCNTSEFSASAAASIGTGTTTPLPQPDATPCTPGDTAPVPTPTPPTPTVPLPRRGYLPMIMR